ncbi:MAG: hypothetical protein ACRCX2_12410 [Paraclostridium sp.]
MEKTYVGILENKEYGRYVDFYQEDWEWNFVSVYATDNINEAMLFNKQRKEMFESALIEFESRYKVTFMEVTRETKRRVI